MKLKAQNKYREVSARTSRLKHSAIPLCKDISTKKLKEMQIMAK